MLSPLRASLAVPCYNNIVTDYNGMPEIFRTEQAPAFFEACGVCGISGWRMATKTPYSGEHPKGGRHMCKPGNGGHQSLPHTCRFLEMAPRQQCKRATEMLSHQGKLPPNTRAPVNRTTEVLRTYAKRADEDHI